MKENGMAVGNMIMLSNAHEYGAWVALDAVTGGRHALGECNADGDGVCDLCVHTHSVRRWNRLSA